jgi:hypothetical protein
VHGGFVHAILVGTLKTSNNTETLVKLVSLQLPSSPKPAKHGGI